LTIVLTPLSKRRSYPLFTQNHNANSLTSFFGCCLCATVIAQCGPDSKGCAVVDSDVEASQPGQAPAQQRHPAYSVLN
jgi:hypothetical protein